MNAENRNLAASAEESQESGPQPQPSCCSQRRCCPAPMVLLALIVLGAYGCYWWFFGRVYRLEVYRAAMQTIQADKELQQELGRPIQAVGWPLRCAVPSARIGDNEIDVRWSIQGPKGHAKAHVLAKRMAGRWETVVLEVALADGKRVSLHVAGDAAAEAPPFEGPQPESKKSKTSAPPPEINLPTPPVDVPGGS